jgi:hypothetical protein
LAQEYWRWRWDLWYFHEGKMKLLDRPPLPRAVRLAGYQPPVYRPKLAQFTPTVNVNPNVKVDAPININLGGLPLSIGLFAGSGLAFLMRTSLPQGWPQTAGLVAGAGLALAGIFNLAHSRAEAATPAPGQPGAPPAAGPSSPQGGITSQAFQPSMAEALEAVTGVITLPQDYSTVSIKPWSSTYPVRIQLVNPSSQPVTFTLELKGEESGSLSPDQEAFYMAQVSLNPGDIKDLDISMPLVSGHVVDVVNVALTASKRRVASENAQILSMRSFIVK